MPIPRGMPDRASSVSLVCRSSWVKAMVLRATNASPVSTRMRGPNLSLRRPPMGMATIAASPWGASSKPASSALAPRTACS